MPCRTRKPAGSSTKPSRHPIVTRANPGPGRVQFASAAQRGSGSTVPATGCHGQMNFTPSGALKQPIDSGNSIFGNQSTALGKKIAKAIVAKKIT